MPFHRVPPGLVKPLRIVLVVAVAATVFYFDGLLAVLALLVITESARRLQAYQSRP